jgi:hypothetical protein
MANQMIRIVATLCTVAVLVAPPAIARDAGAENAALESLDAFMLAFNARDVQAFEATLHFPHYRIAGGDVSVLEKAGTRPDLFERFAATTRGWDHSAWDRRQVIHSGPDKVHIDTRFIRYRADGSVLATFDSLYIVTKQDGHWGIKARSSFAP